jgi:phosphoglycolate phosphatase-like HAD superfamily hydrolase
MGDPMLVIFDVDGTLTLSNRVDGQAYAAAFERTFGIPLPSTRWSEYASPTDQGIAEEVCTKMGLDRGRICDFKDRFIEQLRDQIAHQGLAPVPGARSVLGKLLDQGCVVAIASGGWADSARLKLACAGVDSAGIPLVGSDGEPRREAILGKVIAAAGSPSDAVYVGDGPWDVLAARAAKLRFVGVDAQGTGELRALGVAPVLHGFEDLDAVVAALMRS